jgi:ABC-type phosphate/phosphonate transport system permease subunit
MEISLAITFLGATVGVAAYLLSSHFRAVARDYRHYRWRLMAAVLVSLLLVSWCLPLVVIKDTFSSAFVVLLDVLATSFRPPAYRPDSTYFDYFRRLLGGFAFYSAVGSAILAWLIHCFVICRHDQESR